MQKPIGNQGPDGRLLLESAGITWNCQKSSWLKLVENSKNNSKKNFSKISKKAV